MFPSHDQTAHKKVTGFLPIITNWISIKLLRINPEKEKFKHDWYWKQAIKRHFHIDDNEIESIANTTHSLIKYGNKERILEGTKQIIEGNSEEY